MPGFEGTQKSILENGIMLFIVVLFFIENAGLIALFIRRVIGFTWYEKEYKDQVIDLTKRIGDQETGALKKLEEKMDTDSKALELIAAQLATNQRTSESNAAKLDTLMTRMDNAQQDIRDLRRGGGRDA